MMMNTTTMKTMKRLREALTCHCTKPIKKLRIADCLMKLRTQSFLPSKESMQAKKRSKHEENEFIL